MSKENPLDQFFTPDEVADYCVKFFKEATGETDIKILEPCAGGKAFARAFHNNGYSNFELFDLDPQTEDIQHQDFLKFEESLDGVAVITNPPFGRQSNMSVVFFNKAAKLGAEYISMLTLANHGHDKYINRMNNRYELLDEVYIISDFLTPDLKSRIMPNCRLVFQVWKRSNIERAKIKRKKFVWQISSDEYEKSDFWMKCVRSNNQVFLNIDDFINDSKNYTATEREVRAPSINYQKVVNNKKRLLSYNLRGYKKLPEVCVEDIEEIIKIANWRTWEGCFIFPSTLNQFLDEYYSGKTFKTKKF